MEKLRISIDEKGRIELWMDGCLMTGLHSIELYWEVGEVPTHKLEFISPAAKIERIFSQD